MENLYVPFVAVMLAAGLYSITRYTSFIRLIIGLELVASSAAISAMLFAGTGFYLYLAVIDTVTMAVAAAAALTAKKLRGVKRMDELEELRG